MAQPSLPSTFKSQTISSPEGADIFVRSGGAGPVVVLIHGYAETSDSWGPLAATLDKNYTVVVPDLRGIGRSSRPAGGYDKKTQAAGHWLMEESPTATIALIVDFLSDQHPSFSS